MGMFGAESMSFSAKRAAPKSPATDEERLMIMKMLQDGKITVQEAEALLKALER
jgi:hypothetical protein